TTNTLVVDIGGTGGKNFATRERERRRVPSGPPMTPPQKVNGGKELSADWKNDVGSICYPGLGLRGRIGRETHNHAAGWVGFDFQAAFGRPVKVINDAAMQALGSYESGLMLFLGLGTGLGSALVAEGTVWPMELAHLSYKKGTLEDYVGLRGL